MAEQYWIGGFYIDLSRNQITQNNQSQTLAPKALAVLTYLAKNQGKVVSHDDLLDNVWQGTVVSQNTLQRSIAQLRKALGDDGKDQAFIKTHAKQGYSLECDVRWQSSTDSGNASLPTINIIEEASAQENDDAVDVSKPERKTSKFSTLVFTIIGIFILGFITYQSFAPQKSFQLSVGEMRALTATDNKESSGSYSPDGKYIVFLRYSEEVCVSNVWAQNIQTKQEFQLTKNLDTFGSLNFSPDGKTLAFVQSLDCSQPVTQKQCFNLMSLDFEEALKSSQSPTSLMECQNSEIRDPTWLDNNTIVLMQKNSERWKLIRYSISENTSQTIYEIEEGNFFRYDVSLKEGLIALTAVHHDGNNYIEILDLEGQLLSSHRIKYPKEIANFRIISPNFSPFKDLLVFSTGRQLFTLSYKGEVTNISLPVDRPMGTPIFHPDEDRMLVIKGFYDSDIASMPLAKVNSESQKNEQSEKYRVIGRSNASEDNALFQPNGELVIYESSRTGVRQIWVADGSETRPLTDFPKDTYFIGMDWSIDGNSFLVNVNKTLNQVSLDGNKKEISLPFPVENLFQWDSENQTALVRIRKNGVLRLAELNLATSEVTVINEKQVIWALKSESGVLIYMDRMERFWLPGPAEDKLIEPLINQGSDKHFVIKDDVIYGVNDDFQLWSYSLQSESFEVIGDLPRNMELLTDVNDSEVLMSVYINAKKEVAEIILK